MSHSCAREMSVHQSLINNITWVCVWTQTLYLMVSFAFVFFRNWQQSVRVQATVAHWSLTSVTCPTRRRSCPCSRPSRLCTRAWTYASTMLDWPTTSPCSVERQRAGGTWSTWVYHRHTNIFSFLEGFVMGIGKIISSPAAEICVSLERVCKSRE